MKHLNDSREVSATLYIASTILAVAIIFSFIFQDRLNVYGMTYGIGITLSSIVVLIVVFFTKVRY